MLRSADVGDGAALANLYREVHTPPSGGNAEDHYPFPQYLNGAGTNGSQPGPERIPNEAGEQRRQDIGAVPGLERRPAGLNEGS